MSILKTALFLPFRVRMMEATERYFDAEGKKTRPLMAANNAPEVERHIWSAIAVLIPAVRFMFVTLASGICGHTTKAIALSYDAESNRWAAILKRDDDKTVRVEADSFVGVIDTLHTEWCDNRKEDKI